MKSLFRAPLAVFGFVLVVSACGSDSDDATQKQYVQCGGQGTQSQCTIKCPGWDAECEKDPNDGRMMCECTEGPKLGFVFEQPDACASDSSFNAQDQCS